MKVVRKPEMLGGRGGEQEAVLLVGCMLEDDHGARWNVAAEVVVADGAPIVQSLDTRPADARSLGRGVDWRLLRNVPIGAILAAVTGEPGHVCSPAAEPGTMTPHEIADAVVGGAIRRRRDDLYEVARDYVAACQVDPHRPIVVMSQRTGLPSETLRKRVWQAREKGYLTRSGQKQQGRAGGMLADPTGAKVGA